MREGQILEALNFVNGFKHGVYVCTTDACQFCQDYKQSIAHIDNPNLYFVESVTDEQKDAVWGLLKRVGFPLTACFWKDDLKFVKNGQPFGEDLNEIMKFLDRFPKDGYSSEERNKLANERAKECKLALYIFPPDLPETARKAALNAKLEHNEIAIDVDDYAKDVPDIEDKIRLFAGMLKFSKLVVYNIFSTDKYSDLSQDLLRRFMEDVDAKEAIEHRTIS